MEHILALTFREWVLLWFIFYVLYEVSNFLAVQILKLYDFAVSKIKEKKGTCRQ
ncbi:MAG: hypothetical protein NC253_01485 [Ruminococcus sp.]|nr:hypothetical protein [Ruminococcus sp.]MCM1381163.1 hypothetical protein [Muribaculaceae bacterium]MCM1479654.1 hypothetical protein [Muribaculaceae bacterium]